MSVVMEQWKAVSIEGCQIRYREKGAGAPLLLLHDYTGMKAWSKCEEELSKVFRVVAVELPGFGESQCPTWIKTMDDLAFFMLDVLDALNVQKAHLVGHSLGGWLAAEFASRYGHRVERLLLVDAMGLHLPDFVIPDIFMIAPEKHQELRYYDPQNSVDDTENFLMVSRAKTMTANLAWNPRFHDPKLIRRLHRLQSPVLLIWGEADRMLPLEYAQYYRRLIPHAQLTVIPEAGHLPQYEQPEQFLKHAVPFLQHTNSGW